MIEWLDTALPPAPHPWLMLIEPEEGVCSRDTRQPYPFDFEKGYGEAKLCKMGLFVAIGYRDEDPKREEHVVALLNIIESIKKTR